MLLWYLCRLALIFLWQCVRFFLYSLYSFCKTSGVTKKVKAAGMKKDCELLHQWNKSITNHMYWVASSTPSADKDLMAAKWTSVTNHIMNIHEHENDKFPKCLHAPLSEEAIQQTAWIHEGKVIKMWLKWIIYFQRVLWTCKPLNSVQMIKPPQNEILESSQ